MIESTCGFVLLRDQNCVLLIKKNKPEWQAGLLNGIGGKIELHETPMQCMVREFEEEAVQKSAVIISKGVFFWQKFCMLEGAGVRVGKPEEKFRVHFFRCFSTYPQVHRYLISNTSERLVIDDIRNVTPERAVPNLPWLIRMALDIDKDAAAGFDIVEHYHDN